MLIPAYQVKDCRSDLGAVTPFPIGISSQLNPHIEHQLLALGR
jgi:hypothetical protein